MKRTPGAPPAFQALTIEGGLISPEWLSKVAQLQAGMQADGDYRVPTGLYLRENIGGYWRLAQAYWEEFARAREEATSDVASKRFVLALLRDVLGFTTLIPADPAVLQDRTYPIGHAAFDGRVPVVVAPGDRGLDTPSPSFGDGARKRSAFGLAQEYLNAHEGALWGIATDGVTLRIVRDNASLTRPAWIEVDVQRIFTEDRYADFATLWLLCHETRFGHESRPAVECALEAWRSAGREEGTRAREQLRRGVEEALVALGQGFLSHPDNHALRSDLTQGVLTTKAYFNQLLRLIYRLIFLLSVEERGLLHPEGTPDAARTLYERGYGLHRLRERSLRRRAHDRFSDLWESVKLVLRGAALGEPRLGLPALAGIFSADQCAALDSAKLENQAILLAIWKLSWLHTSTGLSRVNWRDMGSEELGSVYESLLELHPEVSGGRRRFRFVEIGAESHTRRSTGSYYTPEHLVQVLLDRTLNPVIADVIAANPGRQEEALLELAVVDPSCGSGHFLLAAGRRIASKVAELRAKGSPSPADYRYAVRQVVGRCLFGVDLNPLAVELCRVSLWMEALAPGRPLSFLDAHIQVGNSLFGATPQLLETGLPQAAWNAVEGDDARIAKAVRVQSDRERTELALDLERLPQSAFGTLRAGVAEMEAVSDDSLSDVNAKAEQWDSLVKSIPYEHQRLVLDMYCAAFVWKLQPETRDVAPTEGRLRGAQVNPQSVPSTLRARVAHLRDEFQFFHWHLAFPHIFGKGGFDVALGNPPWIAHAGRAAQPLQPGFKKFCKATYASFAGYPTTHGMFVGLAGRLLRPGGALGLIIPASVSELPKYEPTRRAHDELCDLPEPLVDFGEGQFPGVTQPCMAVTSRRVDGGRKDDPPGAAWLMERPDLNDVARALLARLDATPRLPRDLFGERGFQSDVDAQEHMIESPHAEGRYTFALREGTDIREFQRLPPRMYADPVALAARMRSADEYRSVRFVVRNTARYPIAALSDGLGFRNSLLAGFENDAWSPCALVAFLNSALVRWQHYARFRDARQPIMPQVKIGHLRSIPEPTTDLPGSTRKLHTWGERLGAANSGISAADRVALDTVVFDAFSLGDDARRLVTEWHQRIHEKTGKKRRRKTAN